MGYARRQERKARHAAGEFDAKKLEHDQARAKDAKPFNTKIFATIPPSNSVFWYGIHGTSSRSDRVRRFKMMNPSHRIVCVKHYPHKRWVKPEHPIAMRRRLRKEKAERLAAKRLPVV